MNLPLVSAAGSPFFGLVEKNHWKTWVGWGGVKSKVLLQRTKKNNQSTTKARWFFDPPIFWGEKGSVFFWKGSKVSPVSTNDIEMRSRLIWKGLFLKGKYCYQGGKCHVAKPPLMELARFEWRCHSSDTLLVAASHPVAIFFCWKKCGVLLDTVWMATRNPANQLRFPRDPITLSDDEQGVCNHLQNARYLGSMKPFSVSVIGSLGVGSWNPVLYDGFSAPIPGIQVGKRFLAGISLVAIQTVSGDIETGKTSQAKLSKKWCWKFEEKTQLIFVMLNMLKNCKDV